MEGFVGGVALIKFPGGFGLLELVLLGNVLFLLSVFSSFFLTSIFVAFCRFCDPTRQPFSNMLTSFLHTSSDVDFT